MTTTYCGLSFEEAHAIFKQDEWFKKPSDRYLQIDICAKKVNNPAPGFEHVSKTIEFATESARAALTEDGLKERDNLLSFMFSVSLNKAPLAYIKDNLVQINANLNKVADKNTYKKYVGHLAWLKTTWDPSSDPLTKELFSKLGAQISKDNEHVTLDIDSDYYTEFAKFVSTEQPDKISTGLQMDLDRFNKFYAAITRAQKGGRKHTHKSQTLKKKTISKYMKTHRH